VNRLPLGTRSILFLFASAACGNGGGGSVVPGGSNNPDTGSPDGGANTAPGSTDAGVATSAGDAYAPSDGPTEQSPMNADSGGAPPDAGTTPTDEGGMQTEGGTDGGPDVRDVGSCCMVQSTPGCSNASLEVCVCEKDPTCCTTAWTAPCVLIVQQKYCQPGVRDCVCGTDAGQWGQTDCCTTDWNSTCDSVANLKCNAVQGCF
jgi:hypothetical protein